jgi:hypothetical protein
MSKQPEREPLALRLASVAIVNRGIGWQSDATKELERLHSVNVALLEALEEARGYVYASVNSCRERFRDHPHQCAMEAGTLERVDATIAAAKETQ